MIPPWLAAAHPPPAPSASGEGKGGFLEKTLAAAASFAGETLLADGHARRARFLWQFDPCCKLVSILALIVALSLLRSPWTIWGIWLLAIVLAIFSGLGPRFYFRKGWLVMQGIAAAVAMPAVLNFITPGEPLWVVLSRGENLLFGLYQVPAQIAITREGVEVALVLVGRVAASATLATLLPLTTRWDRLLRALAVFRVPQLFTMMLAMTYRYIAHLVQTMAELHEARKSRTIRYLSAGEEQRWIASRIGYLFGKSFRLSRDVHDAMLARGYSGELVSPALEQPGRGDLLRLLLVVLFSVMVIVLDRHVG